MVLTCFVVRYGYRKTPTGFDRLLHLLSFAVSSIPVMVRQIFWRPDRIFVIEPTLFCAPWALVTARLANAKAWLHIQDFEAEAFFGLGFSFRWLRKKVRQRSRRLADAPVRPRLQHLAANGGEAFRVRDPRRSDNDLSQLGGYRPDSTRRPRARLSGGMGSGARSQDCVVRRQHGEEAGARDGAGNRQGLAERRPGCLFLLVGEGSAKEGLVQRAGELGLRNVVFKPPQPPEDFPALLTLADVHLVVQKKGVAEAFMPSKLTGILAVGGTAIITADEDTELGRLVKNNPGIAVLVPPENQGLFQEALRTELSNDRNGARINPVARKYAERYLATDGILSQFEKVLSAGIMS